MRSFDLENFRAEFTRTLETSRAVGTLQATTSAVQIMTDAIRENPDMLKEIAEAASTT